MAVEIKRQSKPYLRCDVGRSTALRRIRAGFPGLLDVEPDLAEQVVEAGEPAGGAEASEDVELDRLAVEVALEVDEVGLDLADLLAEGRVGADVAGGGDGRALAVDEGEDGVDAVGGDDGVDAVEVGGREAEPGASTGAVGDEASDPVGAAEQAGGLVGRAFGQGLADPGRGDDLAVDLGGGRDLEVEPGLGAPRAEQARRRRPGRGRSRRSGPRPSLWRRAARG